MDHAVALAQIRFILSKTVDRVVRATEIAHAIRLVGGYRWVVIYDVDDTEIATLAWSGAGAPTFPRFPTDQGLCGVAVSSGETVLVDDVTQDSRYLTTFGTTRSEVVVPIRLSPDGSVVGLLDVESERVAAFGMGDLDFLERCAEALTPLWP